MGMGMGMGMGMEPIDPALLRRLADRLLDDGIPGDRFDAEVWLHWITPKLGRYMTSANERAALITSVHREAARNHIDPELILAVIDVESRFNRFAVSRVGALGVMQIMPFWKNEIGRREDNLSQIDINVRYGAAILAHYIERSNGDLVQALSRYNGAHGLLHYPDRVLWAWRHRWQSKLVNETPAMLASCKRYRLMACSD